MKPKLYPTQAELTALFSYEDGVLVWKKTNKVAGRDTPQGYRQVGIKGKIYYLHRLIWIWHYGDPGTSHVDHINHDRGDNRIENLQLLSPRRNIAKRQGKRLAGTHRRKEDGRWVAGIWTGTKRQHLGYFATEYEAHLAYLQARAIIEESNTGGDHH
jgi:hypothetical protein